MCGICGFVTPGGGSAPEMRRRAEGMAGSLSHRGPDDAGSWADGDAGVALGHRRLSILDLSPEGHQPMESACGRYVIAFNGEIYNFRGLARELEAGGARFRGHSDTEVLVEAISAWGLAVTLPRLNGMFAFAVWDRRERRLHLARDPLGEKPLYYGWSGGVFLFGSELKALRGHPAFRAEVDRGAVSLFLRHAYVPGPHTIYGGIAKLPPGTHLEVRPDAGAPLEPRAFWSLREVAERGAADPLRASPEEAEEALDALLRDAVGLRMVADVPLGAFLSGGIDSSTVVALMQAQSTRPVRTFSIGFNEPGFNEAEHARAVAAHLGTDHTELYVSAGEAMAVIPRLPALYDEPFADPSQIPTFLVSQLARSRVTVSLSGDGGDELFAGYTRYFWGRGIWNHASRVPRPVRAALAAGLGAVPPRAWDRAFGALSPLLPGRARLNNPGDKAHKLAEVLAVETPEALHHGLVSYWKDPSSVVRGGAEPPTALTDRARWARLDDFTARMMYLDSVTYLPDDILVKLDRAAMGVSLEGRVPLLDPRVVEFAWRLPLSLKVRDGVGKWLLRKVLYRYVPRALIDRPKQGFSVPVAAWLRGPLRDWAESLLDERRLRDEGLLQPGPVRARWREHLAGRGNHQYLLWNVLMLQAWTDEQRSAAAPPLLARAS